MDRLTVMISSTARDLPLHRKQATEACLRAGMYPEVMEAMPASDEQALAESLAMVDRADIYVGVFAHRYGTVPLGQQKSITHLEYERALKRGIPVLAFLIHKEQPLLIDDVETGDGAGKLRLLKEELERDRVVAYFKTPEDLRGLLVHALNELAKKRQTAELDPVAAARSFHDHSEIPRAPEPYIAHPYTLLQARDLIGRRRELEVLTDWVTRPELARTPILSVIAIGGMGKSALTWKWFNDIAPQEMPGLAGRMWWSFYESDASFDNFVTRALAYMTGTTEKEVGEASRAAREDRLLRLLDVGHWLVVLDGLERLLVAYTRVDAAYHDGDDLDDETANRVAGAWGLPESAGQTFVGKHRLRQAADVSVGRFLRRLSAVHCSRVLISTRLYPAELQAVTGGTLPGCIALFLPGLAEQDALELWRAYGARGSRETMLPFFKSVDSHPLLIQVLASHVAESREAPGDFDAWRKANPEFNPFGLPLVKVQSHVLEHAMRGLGDPELRTLRVIAGFRMPCTIDTLSALLVRAEGEAKKTAAKKPFASLAELDATLTALEDRGLLGWNRRANRYDLHPIVRGVVWDRLDPAARDAIYRSFEGHFKAIPRMDDITKIECLADLTPAIELYHTLVALGRLDAAFVVFRDRIEDATLYRLSASRQSVELLERLFPDGVEAAPRLRKRGHQSRALNALAAAHNFSGRPEQAAALVRRMIAIEVEAGDSRSLETGLENLSKPLCLAGHVREAEASARRALRISRELESRFDEGTSLQYVGFALALRGVRGDAEVALQRATRVFASYSHRQFDGVASALLADQAVWLEDAARARGYADRAWELAAIDRFERDFIRAARLQGTAALLEGSIERADERLAHALARARGIDLFDEILRCLAALAELQRRRGDLGRARELLEDVWDPAERGPYPTFHADARNVLAAIERDAGRRDEAIAAATRAYELAWCDGPPFAYHWGLEKARTLLRELGAAEPVCKPFDESRFEPMPEVEIDPPDDPIKPEGEDEP